MNPGDSASLPHGPGRRGIYRMPVKLNRFSAWYRDALGAHTCTHQHRREEAAWTCARNLGNSHARLSPYDTVDTRWVKPVRVWKHQGIELEVVQDRKDARYSASLDFGGFGWGSRGYFTKEEAEEKALEMAEEAVREGWGSV